MRLGLSRRELDNYAYLVNKYCLKAAKLDTSQTWRLETLREMSPLSNAEVIACLFTQLGSSFMSKLKGHYAFCAYDAHSGRVLAVNDTYCSRDLWQGHLQEDHSLILGCQISIPNESLEGGRHVPIGAGEYKYGWRSAPMVYCSSALSSMLKGTVANSAALAALSVRLFTVYTGSNLLDVP